MMKIPRFLSLLAAAAPLALFISPAADARGGAFSRDTWNPTHLGWLPLEIQGEAKRAARACGEPLAARRLFGLSMRDQVTGENFIALHFDETNCADKTAICSAKGCLHEIFVSSGRSYRLVMREQVEDMKFVDQDGRVWLSVDCSPEATHCAARRRWNGRIFVSAR